VAFLYKPNDTRTQLDRMRLAHGGSPSMGKVNHKSISQGIPNLKSCDVLYIETCAKIGKMPQKPYSGKVMFRIDPETHRKAVIAAELNGKSLNQWAEEVLAKAVDRENNFAEARLSA
ncbi:MAG: type II toxin-antitoxin system HicB family antitoxin, partial [Hoeflea sp.]|nr:type II toxin-antitoxin system HicB family antitoxin [Alphaproteobacteria bacterium]MBV1722774.1 type II toxin-antitoxin system HicB family antitoxin [Hoeflea sp.]MBV1761171.1 type II toxin-antitoxin system HicB family antitoxin [Hoeflea sp.]MBV1784533.1 type II toxin-antitoxin system HicB family antitoxin [Hoeflea sp.]